MGKKAVSEPDKSVVYFADGFRRQRAGKSTFLKCLFREHKILSSQMKFDGQPMPPRCHQIVKREKVSIRLMWILTNGNRAGGKQQMLAIGRGLMADPRCSCWMNPAWA